VLPSAYEPRSTAETVLHEVVRTHLARFLDATAATTDGAGVPRFIEREFRDFLGCGDLRRGFCRVYRRYGFERPGSGVERSRPAAAAMT